MVVGLDKFLKGPSGHVFGNECSERFCAGHRLVIEQIEDALLSENILGGDLRMGVLQGVIPLEA